MNDKQQPLFTRPNTNTTATRYSLKDRTIDDLLTVLRNLGCSYYVKTSEGAELKHGDIVSVKMAPPQRRKRNFEFPKGELGNYVRPFIENLKPGESTFVPGGKYGPDKLQSSTTALCSRLFGNKAYMTSTNREHNALEVLRLL